MIKSSFDQSITVQGIFVKVLMPQSNKNERKQPADPRDIMLTPADCLGLFTSKSLTLQRVDMHIISSGVVGNINFYKGNICTFKIVWQIYINLNTSIYTRPGILIMKIKCYFC